MTAQVRSKSNPDIQNIKVVGINGSPKNSGNSSALIREVLKGAANTGAEIEEVHLAKYNIKYCQGCMQCMAIGSCVLDDDFLMIHSKMLDAQGIVMGAPTYGLAPNALMKNFLDRIGMFAVYTSTFKDKYFIGISTCGKFGAKSVAKNIIGISQGIWGTGEVVGVFGVEVGWRSIKENPNALAKANSLGERMVSDIRNGKHYWHKGLMSRFISNIIMRPAMVKNVLNHKDDDMKGVYKNLLERGLIE